ncbi:MAG: bifunctional aspartate kinase/homoserine dehydrogenase I [Flavobacteriaceae bacterium]
MQVLKFGGTSVGTTKSMLNVMEIILNAGEQDRTIVLVSAFSGITNRLLQATEQAKNENNRYRITLDEIKYKHYDRIDALKIDNKEAMEQFVDEEIELVSELCRGIYLTKSIPHKTEAEIVSVGEKLSSYILAKALNFPHKDSRGIIKTSSKYNNATVDFKQTNANIKDYFSKTTDAVTILGGFIASNKDNETTTLGRGGSDYSASIYAAALDVKKLEIWTDVSGLYTANPKIVKTAFPIAQISYLEAMELSHFGAKVIYPPTIIPVLEKKIPIHIKNTFKPNENGTLISEEIVKRERTITGISHIENIALITLEGNGMIGIPGFSKRLFEALYYEKINVKLITQASSEHSICIAISSDDVSKVSQVVNQAFEYEIITKKVLPLQVETNLSIVAIVGDQMKSHSGITGKLFAALGDYNINVRAIAQGSSEKNISVVIDTDNTSKALNSLHDSFFDNQIKQVNLFVVGIGNVGGKLLDQIKDQQTYLHEKLQVNLRVVAIANSAKMIFNKEGINLSNWEKSLNEGEVSSFKEFYDMTKSLNLRHSIFIDNTANADIVNFYPNYLKAGIGIVVCNKIACSSSYNMYKKLQELSKTHKAPFLYETNVGAGLPIIDTLKNMISSGDEINEIQAVLSGSLNFIFNNYNATDDNKSFYKIVKQAGVEGFTEPDPRIDLSGVDVMRKILILARESGVEMELSDIENNSFLPQSAQDATSVTEFMKVLESESTHFNKMYEAATNNNCRLKYVASFKNGKAKVSLEEIPVNHPFYNLDGSDNIVLFYTKRYEKQPLVVKGAGAGADVTASGLFADIIRASRF